MLWCLRVAIVLSLASGYRRGEQLLKHGNGTKRVLDSLFIDSRSRAHNASSADELRHRHISRDRSKLLEHDTSSANRRLDAHSARAATSHENMSTASTSILEAVKKYTGRRTMSGLFLILLLVFAVVLCTLFIWIHRRTRDDKWLDTDDTSSGSEDGQRSSIDSRFSVRSSTNASTQQSWNSQKEEPRASIPRTSMHVHGAFVKFACPPNCSSGDLVEVPLPNGGTKRIRIPTGVRAGQMISVNAL